MHTPLRYAVAALALSAGVGAGTAMASTVVVPDEFASVQAAIDSGADTVVIREGTYPERPVVDRAVVLQGVASHPIPTLAGLHIYNSNFWANPPLLSVTNIAFAGRVVQSAVAVHPRNLQFSFAACVLDSGFSQIRSMDPDDVALLSFRNCRMRDSNARAYEVLMETDTIDGGVAWQAREPRIHDCWLRGGQGTAITLTTEPHGGVTSYNRIENYATGIAIDGGNLYTLEDNTITHCDTGIDAQHGWWTDIIGNVIMDCGVGVFIGGITNAVLRENVVIASSEQGVKLFGSALIAENNVVRGSQGDGILMEYPQEVILQGNTVSNSGGSGIVAKRPASSPYAILVSGNIGFGNGKWGLEVENVETDLGCNDWFGNRLGAVVGVTPNSGDLNVDPMFCDPQSGDLRLDSSSALVDWPGCGQIGALGVGCGKTATLVQRFAAGRASQGIRVVWEVAEGATASGVWLERTEGGEGHGWTRPITERSIDGRAMVELDRSALPDQAYWYRLVALEGGEVTVLGSPIVVEAQPRLDSRLVEVGPNPGVGPVRIAFTLKQMSSIEIDVFDVQGRKVASPGRGAWPAGTHELVWDGRTRSGEPAPAGMYVVRYAFPGGQDRRAIVRVR